MKGHIEVRSEPGSGSTFSFTASFGRVSAPSVPVPLWPDGPRTLVVEEDSRSLVLLAAALEDLGLPVTGVSSAVDAERELREVSEPYSLALVDFAVIGRERLLSNLRERKICFVLLVRHRDEGRTGDNEVLLRPFTRSGLFRAASEAVRVLAVAKPRSDVAKPTPVAPVPKGVRLLVVEDNVTNQRIARELLEASGYTVDCLSDGREAVEKVLSYSAVLPWAAILMDVQMPEMDGCSATVAIRQRPQFRDIPILAMTAHALADERERCFRAGMNDFISKPVDPEFLLATLRRWVSPQQVPRAEFPFIPGVDTGGAMARVAGNASLYRSLLLTLVREYPATLGALWAALNQGESVRLRQLAHALKGQAGNLGLRGVSDQAGKLESWARQDQLENCVTELGALANSFGVVCGDIASTLEGWSIPAEAANEKWLDLSESVLHFQRLLKDSDGTAPDALQELARRADGQVPTGSLDQLSRLVEQFNFKAALHELERLMAAHVLGTQKGDPR
jgi:CheY-like chemotaxis protein/HPt (histidine-containing phosphotransfer) domain-containing protein